MVIQLEKYKLVEWLVSLNDEAVIAKLASIKKSISKSSDWDGAISNEEKALIKLGLTDIQNGDTYTHEQVMKEIKDSYGI